LYIYETYHSIKFYRQTVNGGHFTPAQISHFSNVSVITGGELEITKVCGLQCYDFHENQLCSSRVTRWRDGGVEMMILQA